MSNIYYASKSIGKLLQKISRSIEVGERIRIVIIEDGISFYSGYFVHYGFEIENLVEKRGEVTIDLIKRKDIKSIRDKNYSWLIKLPRTGKNGKRIFVYKLRTMEPYSEYIQDFVIKKNGLNSDGTIRNDFRVTRVGKFLRRYWLDELPMIINFVKGDLKLIGFRPLSDSMLKQYPKWFVRIRNKYKPGLIPPYYIDRPKSFDELIKSEQRYIERYKRHHILTDTLYLYKFLKASFLKGVRSS